MLMQNSFTGTFTDTSDSLPKPILATYMQTSILQYKKTVLTSLFKIWLFPIIDIKTQTFVLLTQIYYVSHMCLMLFYGEHLLM